MLDVGGDCFMCKMGVAGRVFFPIMKCVWGTVGCVL